MHIASTLFSTMIVFIPWVDAATPAISLPTASASQYRSADLAGVEARISWASAYPSEASRLLGPEPTPLPWIYAQGKEYPDSVIYDYEMPGETPCGVEFDTDNATVGVSGAFWRDAGCTLTVEDLLNCTLCNRKIEIWVDGTPKYATINDSCDITGMNINDICLPDGFYNSILPNVEGSSTMIKWGFAD